MNGNDLLEQILDRIRHNGGDEELFRADETADWPPDALNELTNTGLLRRARPSSAVECHGCEENCFMPVDVLSAEGDRPARAFIVCNQRGDVGRVHVDIQRLEKWQVTGRSLATALAKLLDFTGPQKISSRQNCWTLGTLKGEQYRKQIILAIESDIILEVSKHKVPLTDLLEFKNGQLVLDKAELHYCSLNPAPSTSPNRRQSYDVKRKARKLDTEARHNSWRKEALKLEKAHPGKPQTWIASQISKMDIAQGAAPETIRKAIR